MRMKKLFLCSVFALLCLLTFVSCNKKQNAIDNLRNFVEKVEKNASQYTTEDWEGANAEFDELILETEKYEYSGEDTQYIAELKGKYAGIKAKYSAHKFIEGLDKAAKELKGAIDGFTKGVLGEGDSSE